MTELILTLGWLTFGLLIGLLTYAARPGQRHRAYGWLRLALSGALMALVGGWIAVPLLGRFFATGVALWFAIAGCLLLPLFIRTHHMYR